MNSRRCMGLLPFSDIDPSSRSMGGRGRSRTLDEEAFFSGLQARNSWPCPGDRATAWVHIGRFWPVGQGRAAGEAGPLGRFIFGAGLALSFEVLRTEAEVIGLSAVGGKLLGSPRCFPSRNGLGVAWIDVENHPPEPSGLTRIARSSASTARSRRVRWP